MFWRTRPSAGRWLPACVAVCLGCTTLLGVAPAAAQPVTDQRRLAARELAKRALVAHERGDYAEALELAQRAYRIVPAPTILLQIARAEREAGKLVEAAEDFRRASRTKLDAASPDAYRAAALDAEDELAALEPRIPQLRIALKPIPAGSVPQVTQDGTPVPAALLGVFAPINPGQHQIRAVALDGTSFVNTIEIREGETRDVVVDFAATSHEVEAPAQAAGAVTPEPGSSAPRNGAVSRNPVGAAASQSNGPHASGTGDSHTAKTLAYLSLGAGAAGLGVGIVSGLMAVSRHSVVEKECTAGRCQEGSTGAEALEDFRRLRMISTVGYVSGAVLAGAGVTLFLLTPRPSNSSVAVEISPVGAQVRGRF